MKNKFKRIITLLLPILCLLACSFKKQEKKPADILKLACKEKVTNKYSKSLNQIAESYRNAIGIPYDSTAIPRSLEPSGELRGVPSHDWCSGFYPGIWWMLYSHTENKVFANEAAKWTNFIGKEKDNIYTHDLGFMIYCSYGWGYQLTQNEDYKAVIIKAAKSLASRFDENIGLIKSWDTPQGHKWTFPVIIDNMMNLELLFKATELSKDSLFYNIAVRHADITMKNHFREDNSSYHVIDYDTITDQPRIKETYQGISDESSWARGQGWGLYGYTVMYRETKDQKYLEQANKIATYIIGRLPQDYVPFWDFDDPAIPDSPRDASAGAIYASALLELQQYVLAEKKAKYLKVAEELLAQLSSEKYLLEPTVEAPLVLAHSTGNYPAVDEIDVPIIYGDYYFIEALLRANRFL